MHIGPIQFSFHLAGLASYPMPPAPLVLSSPSPVPPFLDGAGAGDPPGSGRRLTGVWPAGTPLYDARQQVARYLQSLPSDVRVRDNFILFEQSAAAAAERLAGPPTPQRCLGVRHFVHGQRRYLRLFGLYQISAPDLVLPLPVDGAIPLQEGVALLMRLGAFMLAGRVPFEADKPVPFGWWLLGFGGADVADAEFWSAARAGWGSAPLATAFDSRMSAPAPLFVMEADDVAWEEPSGWELGADRALRTWLAQQATSDRLETVMGEAPNALDAALLCDRLQDWDPSQAFFAYREAPQGPTDSGWRFACTDPDHVHDGQSSRLVHVRHMTAQHPALVQYMALGIGWVVSYQLEEPSDGGPGSGQFWLVDPDDPENRSFLDQGHVPGVPWIEGPGRGLAVG